MSAPLAPKRHARRGLIDWYDMMCRDHGFLRLCFHNLHQIDADMWRSNQPTPARIGGFATMGIKTIINLRGPRDDGGWRLEAEACARHNIELIDFTARSRAAPTKQMLFDLRTLFQEIEKPALLHCKSGADRAGIVAALYLLIHKGVSVQIAQQQLAWRYLHIRTAKTGVLDAFLHAYAPYEAENMPFFTWVESIYDPQILEAEFLSRHWTHRWGDRLLGLLRRE